MYLISSYEKTVTIEVEIEAANLHFRQGQEYKIDGKKWIATGVLSFIAFFERKVDFVKADWYLDPDRKPILNE